MEQKCCGPETIISRDERIQNSKQIHTSSHFACKHQNPDLKMVRWFQVRYKHRRMNFELLHVNWLLKEKPFASRGLEVTAGMWLRPSVLTKREVLLRAQPRSGHGQQCGPRVPMSNRKQQTGPREDTASAFRAGLYFRVTCPCAARFKSLWPLVSTPQYCRLTKPASLRQNELLCITKPLTKPSWPNLFCYQFSGFLKVHILLQVTDFQGSLVVSLGSANPCFLLKTPTFQVQDKSCLSLTLRSYKSFVNNL